MRSLLTSCWLLMIVCLAACGGDDASTLVLVTVRAGTGEQAEAWGSVRLFVDRDGGEDPVLVYDLKTKRLPLEVGVLPRGASLVTVRAEAYASHDGSGDAIASSGAQTEIFKKGRSVEVTLVLGDDAGDGGADAGDGCDGVVGGECKVVPSYLPKSKWSLLYADGTDDVTVATAATWTMDTDTGEVIGPDDAILRAQGTAIDFGMGFEVVPQPGGGPDFGVFYMKSLTVPPGTTLAFVGANVAVLLVNGDVTVGGSVDAGAHGAEAGPAGRDGRAKFENSANAMDGNSNGLPPERGSTVVCPFSGGGGGAGAGAGAKGGMGGMGATWMSGDPAYYFGGPAGMPAADDLLRGGGGGGVGYGCVSGRLQPGGGGGGALLLVSAGEIQVEALAAIQSPGEGAQLPVEDPGHYMGAGAGGGGGGTLVLEAPTVRVNGTVAANGGSGSGGDSSNGNALPGKRGQASADPVAGSVGVADPNAPVAGNGGAGGAGDSAAAEGTAGMSRPEMPGPLGGPGGGGGGGAGRVLIHTLTGGYTKSNAGLLSPSVASQLSEISDTLSVHKLP